MCSLVDQVPKPKWAQLGRVQPYSAGPAELSISEPVVEVSCLLIVQIAPLEELGCGTVHFGVYVVFCAICVRQYAQAFQR